MGQISSIAETPIRAKMAPAGRRFWFLRVGGIAPLLAQEFSSAPAGQRWADYRSAPSRHTLVTIRALAGGGVQPGAAPSFGCEWRGKRRVRMDEIQRTVDFCLELYPFVHRPFRYPS